DATRQMWHATTAQRHDRSGLRTGSYLDRLLAVERFELHRRTECGCGHRHRDFAVPVIAVAGEQRVLVLADRDVEVAGRTAARADLACARQPQAHAVV